MAALSIGGTNYEVLIGGAKQLKPRRVGSETESFDGVLRRTWRAEYRQWEFRVLLADLDDLEALRADALEDNQDCSGYLLNDETVNCSVDVGEAELDEGAANGVYAVAVVTLRETGIAEGS